MSEEELEQLLQLFQQKKHELRIFMGGVVEFIGNHPDLTSSERPVVHSYKSRLKDPSHLRTKILRKVGAGRNINQENLFTEITDLAGVRILHIYQDEFRHIDNVIRKRVADGDWHLVEPAKAYTWDPENVEFFKSFDLAVSEKPSSYTSVHYLLSPRSDSPICCEVQVRTLFEEIWGEVDHQINYPVPTDKIASREQIKVLSKIVGAGSRLLDSLKRVHWENSDS